jgi:Fe-S cluster assembly scaffold protein SufB
VGKNLVHLSVPTDYLNAGVELLGIKEAVRRHESFFKDLYGRVLTSPYSDKYTYLAHALHNAGVFIRIPKNAELEKPFRIVYVLDRENEAVYAKVVVVCGPGSRSSVVEEFHGTSRDAGMRHRASRGPNHGPGLQSEAFHTTEPWPRTPIYL